MEIRQQSLDEFSGHPLKAIDEFEELDKACWAYVKAFKRIYREPTLGGESRANRLFRVLTYRMVRLGLKEVWPFDDLEDRIEQYSRGERGLRGTANVFQRGILAICAHEHSHDLPAPLREQGRYQTGRLLDYANYHLIPPALLDGFLRDVGFRRAIDDAAKGVVHPDYFDWVAHRLSKRKVSRYRLQEYPLQMRKAVGTLQKHKRKNSEGWD